MERTIEKISRFGRVVWLYTKYQMVTKGILTLAVFPLSSFLMKILLQSTGRTNISSGDYLDFVLSYQGAGMLLIGLALLILLIGIDVNAFIIMSALIREGRVRMTARNLFVIGIRSLRSFLKPSGILIMLYTAIVVPLVGIGVTISPMKGFEVPRFITDVIFKNALYTGSYLALLSVLTYVSIRYIFFFHYVLLEGQKIREALISASQLMRRHFRSFLKDFIGWALGWTIAATATLGVAEVFIWLSGGSADTLIGQRVWMILGLLVVAECSAFVALMTVPILCHRLTELFCRYREQDGEPVILAVDAYVREQEEKPFPKIRFRTKVAAGLFFLMVMALNFLAAVVGGVFFDPIFRSYRDIDIVAHRGGGDLAAENTIASLEAAIREGVAWSEIDVQRTADGRYVINHDPTFARVAGESRSAVDMTLEEIKQLEVRDLFDVSRPSQKVATMEEFLEAAKGRIGLFIELKGSTADPQMADDIVKMVREYQMEDEVAILSLDYHLIRYIEENYPEVKTGFLYFFSIGDTAKMKGDILIMEEREATPEKIDEIHDAGKQAIVWTVNTDKSIDRFVNSEVDGIITDYVLRVKEGIQRREDRSDLEIIMDRLLH